MYANSGDNAAAVRPFTGGPLSPGQVFSIDFDNGWLDPTAVTLVGLADALGNQALIVYFVGGGANYWANDYTGSFDTGLGFGDEGLRLTITMTGVTNYTAQLTRFDGISTNWAGSLAALPEVFVARNFFAGPGSSRDFFINSMSITPIPEPSTLALTALGFIGLVIRVVRRRTI